MLMMMIFAQADYHFWDNGGIYKEIMGYQISGKVDGTGIPREHLWDGICRPKNRHLDFVVFIWLQLDDLCAFMAQPKHPKGSVHNLILGFCRDGGQIDVGVCTCFVVR